MRIGFVVVGLVLLVLGIVLTFVPVAQVASVNIAPQPGFLSYYGEYNASISGISLTGSVPVSVSWTANATVTAYIETCSQALSNPTTCPGTTTVVVNGTTGSSGSASFSVPDGGYFSAVIFASNGATHGSLTITVAETTVGLLLFVIGIVLLIVGVVFGRKRTAAPAPEAPVPATPPPT